VGDLLGRLHRKSGTAFLTPVHPSCTLLQKQGAHHGHKDSVSSTSTLPGHQVPPRRLSDGGQLPMHIRFHAGQVPARPRTPKRHNPGANHTRLAGGSPTPRDRLPPANLRREPLVAPTNKTRRKSNPHGRAAHTPRFAIKTRIGGTGYYITPRTPRTTRVAPAPAEPENPKREDTPHPRTGNSTARNRPPDPAAN